MANVLFADHRNRSPVTASGLWNQSADWRENAVPVDSDFAWINDVSKPCYLNSVQYVQNFSVGNNNTGKLIISNGGELTCSSWCGNGMGSGASLMTIEASTTQSINNVYQLNPDGRLEIIFIIPACQ